jgi:hypothetical protein
MGTEPTAPPSSFLDALVTLAEEVVHAQGGEARIEPAPQGEAAAVTIRPTRASACPVELWADPAGEQVGLVLGVAKTPYDRVFGDLGLPDVWSAALEHLRELLTAVIGGPYRQERFVRRDGTPILTRGIFELTGGAYEHIARHSLSLFRRRKREDVSFDPY